MWKYLISYVYFGVLFWVILFFDLRLNLGSQLYHGLGGRGRGVGGDMFFSTAPRATPASNDSPGMEDPSENADRLSFVGYLTSQ